VTWNSITQLLDQHGIGYRVTIDPNDLLVHPENRGKLPLNAFNVHGNGARIKKAGADPLLLNRSTCFEICPTNPIKEKQLDFNRNAVAQSGKMLAPVKGTERYLSVAGSHAAAFCKAMKNRCLTPQTSLADDGGRLSIESATGTDAAFRTMFEKGWLWTVIPWTVESRWPQLPALAQRALNASNGVVSETTELEVMSEIASFVSRSGPEVKNVWTQAVEAALALNPPCSGCIQILAKYTKLYGGSGSIIRFLHKFAAEYVWRISSAW
jgi:hypothetical protein